MARWTSHSLEQLPTQFLDKESGLQLEHFGEHRFGVDPEVTDIKAVDFCTRAHCLGCFIGGLCRSQIVPITGKELNPTWHSWQILDGSKHRSPSEVA